jgi:hypothetical protein
VLLARARHQPRDKHHHHQHHRQQHHSHHHHPHYQQQASPYYVDNSGGGNARLRLYQLNIGEGAGDVGMRHLSVPEDCVVQSARCLRPKTSITTAANTARSSRYYRQQPHPDARSQRRNKEHDTLY